MGLCSFSQFSKPVQLTTEIPFSPISSTIGYTSRCVFSGSCFSSNIGEWLQDLKFDVAINLCGISYNPISLARHIRLALSGKGVAESELQQSRDQFVHPDFHSIFNAQNSHEALTKINQGLKEYCQALRQADFLFVTFGTAIGFESMKTSRIVNNCHHLPSSDFTQRMMSDREVFEAMEEAVDLLHSQNPEVYIVFTVSPIRHLRQGGIVNMRSKARLIRLCENLENRFSQSVYLPVYEYVMDELRDYRYYRQDDLIHLNDLGIGLIREKVKEAAISPDAYPLMHRIEKWNAMKGHKVQNVESEANRKFEGKLAKETLEIKALLPNRF